MSSSQGEDAQRYQEATVSSRDSSPFATVYNSPTGTLTRNAVLDSYSHFSVDSGFGSGDARMIVRC